MTSQLENDDLIVVGPYTNRVTISSGVKTPGKFEIKNGETLSDLIKYSGGFSENSYSKSVRITRIFDEKYKIVDVYSDQFDFFELIFFKSELIFVFNFFGKFLILFIEIFLIFFLVSISTWSKDISLIRCKGIDCFFFTKIFDCLPK